MNQLEVAKSSVLMSVYHIKGCIFASYDIKQLLLNQSQMNETWPSRRIRVDQRLHQAYKRVIV